MLTKGSVVWLDFDLRVEGLEGLFDTTSEARAKEAGIHEPGRSYGPVVAIVGGGRLVPGLDEALLQAKVGETNTANLSPEKAFGQRDPKLIEVVPSQHFKRAKVEPEVGKRVTYKDRAATITRLSAGRVWVDTNSLLAGKKCTFTYTVRKVAETPEERAEALVRMHYDPGQPFKVTYHEEEHSVDVQPPAAALYDERWLLAKFRIVNDFVRHSDLERVRFVEEFSTKVPRELLEREKAQREQPPAQEAEAGKTA